MNKQFLDMFNIDKNQIIKEVKSVGPFLAPFFKASCVYFILALEEPTLIHALVKVSPILCLLFFVYWIQREHSNSYSKLILTGLALSGLGDVLLIWQDTHEIFFLVGMCFFALGHLAYIVAFGFKPFGLKEFLLATSLTLVIYCILLPGLLSSTLMTVAVGVYAMLIGAMAWRALARFNLRGEIPWRKVYAFIGAMFFVWSDTVLGVNKFIWEVPRDKEMIMVPYYLAQMSIALSIINSRVFVKKSNGTTCAYNATNDTVVNK